MKNAKKCPKWYLNFGHLKLFYGQIMHFYEDRNLFFIVSLKTQKIKKNIPIFFFGFLANFLALNITIFAHLG